MQQEGTITGFEADGRVRIKLGDGRGAPNKILPKDLRIRELLVEERKLTFGFKVPTPVGQFEFVITKEERIEKVTITSE